MAGATTGMHGMANKKVPRLDELTKIKIVLLALWDNQPHPEAQEIIDDIRRELR